MNQQVYARVDAMPTTVRASRKKKTRMLSARGALSGNVSNASASHPAQFENFPATVLNKKELVFDGVGCDANERRRP